MSILYIRTRNDEQEKKKCTKIDQQEERRRIIKGRHLGLWEAVLSTPELNLYVQFFILLNNVFNEQP